MEIKVQKDILDIIKDIKDIDEQLNSSNPDCEKLQEITLKAKLKFQEESTTYEVAEELKPNTQYISINQMSINDFIQRLPFYKSLYIKELKSKCDLETFNKLSLEYEIKE